MAQRVYLIDTERVKKNTLIDSSVSDKTLSIIIKTAHLIYLQELLGTPLFTKLNDNIIASGLTALQDTLIKDYILDYLYATVEYLSIDDLLIKLTDAGVNSTTPPNTQQRTKDELTSIKAHKEKAMNFYAGLIKTFILNNINSFPEYDLSDEGIQSKKYNTFGFVCYDEDFTEDANYHNKKGTYLNDESI
jgi:hypothetical protein